MKICFSKLAIYLFLTMSVPASGFAAPIPFPPEKPFQLAQNKGGGDSNSSADGSASSAVGGLTVEDKSYVREYNLKRGYPSVKYDRDISIGQQLPETNTYYPIEGRQSLSGYRYSVINGRTVLVDRDTRRIVEVID